MNRLLLASAVKERYVGEERFNVDLLRELNDGQPLSGNLLERLSRLYDIAMASRVRPVKESYVVLARRGDTVFFKRPPRPSNKPGRVATNETFAELLKRVKGMSYEEVAKLVGGRVVDVGEYLGRPELKGKKAVLVDGQLLTKAQAILKLMKGKRFVRPKTRLEKLIEVLEDVLVPKE